MRILLDTHALLWFVLGDLKLSRNARAEMESSANEKVVKENKGENKGVRNQ